MGRQTMTTPLSLWMALSLLVLCKASPVSADTLPDIGDLMARAEANYSLIHDYTCLMHRREFTGSGYKDQDSILMKFKKPGSFYLKWRDGTEALYCKDRYDGKLVVHLGGLMNIMTVAIDPQGRLAMHNNRHPVFDAGIGHFIELIRTNYLMAKRNNENNAVCTGEEWLGNRKTLVFKASFPPGKGYYAGRVVIYIDSEKLLPVKTEAYDWNNQLLEMYSFSDIRYDTGLTDADFERENKAYDF